MPGLCLSVLQRDRLPVGWIPLLSRLSRVDWARVYPRRANFAHNGRRSAQLLIGENGAALEVFCELWLWAPPIESLQVNKCFELCRKSFSKAELLVRRPLYRRQTTCLVKGAPALIEIKACLVESQVFGQRNSIAYQTASFEEFSRSFQLKVSKPFDFCLLYSLKLSLRSQGSERDRLEPSGSISQGRGRPRRLGRRIQCL